LLDSLLAPVAVWIVGVISAAGYTHRESAPDHQGAWTDPYGSTVSASVGTLGNINGADMGRKGRIRHTPAASNHWMHS